MSDLTAEELRRLLSYDAQTGLFTRNGKIVGTLNTWGYVQICVKNKRYLAHRLAWLYIYGKWPATQIDHINRRKTDNRAINLREVTNSENAQNSGAHKDNAGGTRGIYFDKSRNRWVAELCLNDKVVFKQRFKEKLDAINARAKAEEQFHPYRPCETESNTL